MKIQEVCNFLLVCFGISLAGSSYSVPAPIYPSEALDRGLSVSHSGFVLGAGFIASFIFTPFTGYLMGRFGATKVFFAGNLIIAMHNVFFGFLNYIHDGTFFFWLSLVSRVFNALGESLITPASYPLGAAQFSEKSKGKAIAIVESSFGMGMVFGPAIGGFLDSVGGFACPFWAIGAGLLAVNVLGLFTFNSKEKRGEDNERSTSWKDVLYCPGVLIFASGAVFCGSAQAWYMASMEPHLLEAFGLDSLKTGLILMAYSLTYTILSPVLGGVLDRGFSTMKAVILGNTIIMLAFLILGPVPGMAVLRVIPVTVVALMVQGIGATLCLIGSLIGMIEFAKLGDLPQTDQTTGMVSSVWLLGICLGEFLGSTLGSFSYDHLGFSWSSTIISTIMGFSVIFIIISSRIFLRRPKKTGSV